MPRPKKDPDAVLELELRITPPSQTPITDWLLNDDFDNLVMFMEGGPDTTKKLHYHGYVKTKRSKSWVRDWIYKITDNVKYGLDGNAVYAALKPHDHTLGYIAKEGRCVARYNYAQTTIDEWITNSAEYRKQKESQRKRVSRTREDELNCVIKEVENHLKTLVPYQIDARVIVDQFLSICHTENIRFPHRSQMDNIILKLLYPYDVNLVRSFYTSSFDRLRL